MVGLRSSGGGCQQAARAVLVKVDTSLTPGASLMVDGLGASSTGAALHFRTAARTRRPLLPDHQVLRLLPITRLLFQPSGLDASPRYDASQVVRSDADDGRS